MLDSLPNNAEGGRDGTAQRESSEQYSKVICRSGEFRVIVCKGDLQWIAQKQDNATKSLARARWRGLKYFRTQKALMAFWRGLHQACACEAWPELERLPENFSEFRL